MSDPSRNSGIFPNLCIGYNFSDGSCPIAAIQYQENSPNELFNIDRFDTSIYQNSDEYYKIDILHGSGNLFRSDYYNYYSGNVKYLVTDTTSYDGSDLFYQYELMYNCYGDVQDPNIILIYKNNETVINQANYLIQFSNDLISGNIRYTSTDWSKQGDSSQTTHRVRILFPLSINSRDFYLVKYRKNLDGIITEQEELISLRPLYGSENYSYSSSGIMISSGINTQNIIKIIKDPDDKISVDKIISTTSSGNSAWKLTVKPGTIIYNSGVYSGSLQSSYQLTNYFSSGSISLSGIIPESVHGNIIKLDSSPIYIPDSYIYPSYKLNNLTLNINDIDRTDINILSIDEKRGYIHLDHSLGEFDNIKVNYELDCSGTMIVNGLEFNPISSGSLFNVSGYPSGFGLALNTYSGSIDSTYLYIYNLSESIESRNCYSIVPSGSTTATSWSDGNFITLCEITPNKFDFNDITITDARRIGGGYKSESNIINMLNSCSGNIHEKDWYTDIGFYGGNPLSFNSIIIINVPLSKINSERQRWISDAITYSSMSEDQATKAFNYHLDQTIKKYISGGSDYVLIPITSSGTFGDILDLEA